MQVVQYALKFKKEDGLPILRAWLVGLPSIDLERLQRICQRLAREKKADQYAKICLYDVQAGYEHAGPAVSTATVSDAPPCGDCGTLGVVYVVRAGQSAGRTSVVSRHEVKPYAYCCVDTVPCVCERGATYREKTRPGSDAGFAARSWSLGRVKDIWARCVFEDGNAAERFKFACIEMRRRAVGAEMEAVAEAPAAQCEGAKVRRCEGAGLGGVVPQDRGRIEQLANEVA